MQQRASVVIMALPEIEPARLAVQRLRRINATVPILARAHGRKEAEYLMAVGASEVIQPEIEAAGTVIRHVLELLGLPKEPVLDSRCTNDGCLYHRAAQSVRRNLMQPPFYKTSPDIPKKLIRHVALGRVLNAYTDFELYSFPPSPPPAQG